jgi:hypothetical protein
MIGGKPLVLDDAKVNQFWDHNQNAWFFADPTETYYKVNFINKPIDKPTMITNKPIDNPTIFTKIISMFSLKKII